MTEDRAETSPSRVSDASTQTLSDSLSKLWALLRPRKWQVLGLSLLLSLTAVLAQLSPQFVRIVIDDLIPRGELRLFLLMAAGMLVFYLLSAAVGYAAMYYSYAFTQAVISDVRLKAYGSLLALPLTRFTKERSGSLVSRVVSDVNALETMIQSGASRLLGQLFSVLVVLGILFWMNVRLALVSVVIVAVMVVVTALFQGPLRASARRIRSRVGDLTATATEAIGNIAVVKVFANEALELQRFRRDNDDYVRLNLGRRKQVGAMEGLVELGSQLGLAGLLLLGAWLVVGGGLSIGELSAFLLYLRNLIGPVMSVMFFNNALQSGLAALERVTELLEDQPETEGDVADILDTTLVFDDVRFTYPGDENEALRGLNLQLVPGETVALVGPSGAGKSTVTKLLSRLYDPTGGRITLGGLNLRDYRLKTLRRTVAHVPQEPTLFSGTVAENIRYAKPDASPAEVRRAAELANAHGFIEALPSGYDTEIGERGVKLSGGQKQRVAIARAILKGARILVLDEATSSLDSESEALIQDALEGIWRRQGATSLVIAHRLSTVQNADRIFVLAAGRVVEAGTHRQLLARGGLYRTLYDLQFKEVA
ncbi:ABC transporter ATP-binding protein [soil metagenome]